MVSDRQEPVTECLGLASMEPCLFRHGKRLEEFYRPTPAGASMEPCLFRHGKRTGGRGEGRGDGLASMEPCLFRHGKDVGLLDFIVAVWTLQWSHVFSDMVRDPRPLQSCSISRASMEPCLFRHGKSQKLTKQVTFEDASMEPCLFRHGKAVLVDVMPGQIQLASMEPCLFRHGKQVIPSQKTPQPVCFNGAMSFQTW